MQPHWKPQNLLKTQISLSKVGQDYVTVFCVTDWFALAKLTERESEQASHTARSNVQKRKPIRRPKGSKWKLINEMGLAHDVDKYKRIIVCFSILQFTLECG